MPKIREYEAANVKLNPSNLGETALDQAARRLGTYTTQEASGAREIGQLQEKTLVDEGKQIEAFLRYTGLSQEASSGGGVRLAGGGRVDRSLLGTGSSSNVIHNIPDPTDFEGQGELLRGARGISRLTDKLVSNATPLYDLPNPKHEKEIYDKETADKAPYQGGEVPTPRLAPDTGDIWAPPGSWSPSVPTGAPAPSSSDTTATPDLNTGGMDTPYPYPSTATAPDTSAAAPAPSTDQPSLFSDVASDIRTWMTSP